VKLNVAGQSFEREASSLCYLRGTARFPCPEVYLEDSSARSIPYTFLLLETLAGSHMWELPLPVDDRQHIERQLAEVLLGLHSHTRDTFGAIGDVAAQVSWADVFLPRLREVRAEPMLDARLPTAVLLDVDRAIGQAGQALSEQGQPTLVHGDLWAANVIVQNSARGFQLSGIIDPNAQYADAELELAYLEEFSHVAGPTFFAAYHTVRPRRPGYERRRLFYWLHSYLIHVWLFEDQIFRDKVAWVVQQILQGGQTNDR
jgi:fructosamine-3-kinase